MFIPFNTNQDTSCRNCFFIHLMYGDDDILLNKHRLEEMQVNVCNCNFNCPDISFFELQDI